MKVVFTSFLLFLFTNLLCGQSGIDGIVLDKDTRDTLVFANIIVTQNEQFITGVSTDFDGKFQVELEPDKYDIEISYVGFPTKKIVGIVVKKESFTELKIEMEGMIDFGVPEYGLKIPLNHRVLHVPIIMINIPIIDIHNLTTEETFEKEEIQKMPTKNIHEISTNVPGVSIQN